VQCDEIWSFVYFDAVCNARDLDVDFAQLARLYCDNNNGGITQKKYCPAEQRMHG